MTQLMTVSTADASFPTDGNGAATSKYATDKVSTGSEVFTATGFTATWGAGAGPTQTNAVSNGDYVATSDGCWGVIVSASTATATAASVDFWRSAGQPNKGYVNCIPVAGSTIRIYNGKCHLVGSRRPRITRIILTKAAAADTVAITDSKGTAVYTYTTRTAIAAGANNERIEFLDGQNGGRFTDGPFGIKLSATTTEAIVEYEP